MAIWKPVKGFEGMYEVSSDGRVKSLEGVKVGRRTRRAKEICQQKQWTGYKQVALFDSKGGKSYHKVHRLVAEAFLDNPEGKPQVNHKNGVRDDNRLENLEWVTISENHKHAFNELGKKPSRANLGKPSPRRKLTREHVEAIKRDSRSAVAIAKDYGVCSQTIRNVKTGAFYKVWE